MEKEERLKIMPFFIAGCPAKKDFCDLNICQNGGHCVNKWNTYSCHCPLRFGGKNCEQGE